MLNIELNGLKMSEKTEEEIDKEVKDCRDQITDLFKKNDVKANTACYAMAEMISIASIVNGSNYNDLENFMRQVYFSFKERNAP